MKDNIIPTTTGELTDLVKALLKKLEQRDAVIERLHEDVRLLKEQNQFLLDEIAILKKTSKRPKIQPNKKPKNSSTNEKTTRPGSEKKAKSLVIHETKVITPLNLPEGSTLKRKRHFDVQDLIIKNHNTRYILEVWETPEGKIISAQMPEGISQDHFGNELCSFILYQHHQCQVTQPLLHEQLSEFGIDISTGQIHNILTEDKAAFHREKLEILQSGLKASKYIQVDDTGARHEGKSGFCTQFGNEYFAWFQSSFSKSRINFLQIINAAYPNAGYLLDENAFKYMKQEGLPLLPLNILTNSMKKKFLTKEAWQTWLRSSAITRTSHIRIATEAVLLAGALAGGLNSNLVILSDGAGQFNIPLLMHALCWIHEERHIKKLVPTTDITRAAQQEVLDDFWSLYRRLKKYKENPTKTEAEIIETTFDELFKRKTLFASLNLVLKHIFAKKNDLLLVLTNPFIPLHNNGSEGDVREFVKRRKVSGGTRSLSGQQCRDTFASLKKTCRKLGVSFYSYLKDRISGLNQIAQLGLLIEQTAKSNLTLLQQTPKLAA